MANKNYLMRYISSLLCLIVFFSNLYSQSHTLFGQWKSYLPYHRSYKITETPHKVFCNTQYSLYSVDKEDLSLELYDKTNYLNDINVCYHTYDPYNDQVIIFYNNGNIDLLGSDGTRNATDILDNVNINTPKTINDVFVADADHAYLAYDYGLTEFNPRTLNFGFTCFTGFEVNTVLKRGEEIYIGSEQGILKIDLSKGLNTNDISIWDIISIEPCNDLINYNGELLIVEDYRILKLNSDGSSKTVFNIGDNIHNIKSVHLKGDTLVVSSFYNGDYSTYVDVTNLKGYEVHYGACIANINDAIIDNEGKTWYSGFHNNLSYSEGINLPCKSININSPYSIDCADLYSDDGYIFVASGGVKKINYDYAYNDNGFYYFKDGLWKSVNKENSAFIRNHNIQNFLNIISTSDNKTAYVGTYGHGLIELNLENDSIKLYDASNSLLREVPGDPGKIRIADFVFDSKGNLWMSQFATTRQLVVKSADGHWYSFVLPTSSKNLADMTIDEYDRIWIKELNNGAIIFDYNNTLDNTTDDKTFIINESNTVMGTDVINCMKTDLDGNIWVGTDKGPVAFECASQIMDGNCSGTKKKTVLNGIAEYVLNEVNINCIEVDGANRKWIGTSSGVYVLNPSGEEELEHFTKDNSPLFSNQIYSLAFNKASGEMMIGTEYGLLSYKTETIEGTSKNKSEAYAYPNPVPPDYNGKIAIKGLARDSNVKITDISGNLIFETKSLGGQAIWDGTDFRGNRVGSGVYIALCSNVSDVTEKDVIAVKIFFVK